MKIQTYVYDSNEVILTGRRAKKKNKNEGQRRRARKSTEDQILVEIETTSMSLPTMKQWVSMDDLFEVIEDETIEGMEKDADEE